MHSQLAEPDNAIKIFKCTTVLQTPYPEREKVWYSCIQKAITGMGYSLGEDSLSALIEGYVEALKEVLDE